MVSRKRKIFLSGLAFLALSSPVNIDSVCLKKEYYSIGGKNVSIRFFLDNRREVSIEGCSYWDREGNGNIAADDEQKSLYCNALKIRKHYLENCVR